MPPHPQIPSNRLVALIKQACCFQALVSMDADHKLTPDKPLPAVLAQCLHQRVRPPRSPHPQVHSLLEDYSDRPLPDTLLARSAHVGDCVRVASFAASHA